MAAEDEKATRRAENAPHVMQGLLDCARAEEELAKKTDDEVAKLIEDHVLGQVSMLEPHFDLLESAIARLRRAGGGPGAIDYDDDNGRPRAESPEYKPAPVTTFGPSGNGTRACQFHIGEYETGDGFRITVVGFDAEQNAGARAIAEQLAHWLTSACPVYNRFCPVHGFVHGQEAEELRTGIERLAAVDPDEEEGVYLTVDGMLQLLDNVDARDSCAYGEAERKDADGE